MFKMCLYLIYFTILYFMLLSSSVTFLLLNRKKGLARFRNIIFMHC